MKEKADWGTCPCGETEGRHEWRDHCWICAPWWWDVPYCPRCKRKLTETGWCKNCKRHFEVKEGRPND